MHIGVNITMADGETPSMTVDEAAQAIFDALGADLANDDSISVQVAYSPVTASITPADPDVVPGSMSVPSEETP